MSYQPGRLAARSASCKVQPASQEAAPPSPAVRLPRGEPRLVEPGPDQPVPDRGR